MNAVSEGCQGKIDFLGLIQPVGGDLRLLDSLASSKVNEIEHALSVGIHGKIFILL